MIPVPHDIEFERGGGSRRGMLGSGLCVRVSEPQDEAADFIEQHDNLLIRIPTTDFDHAAVDAQQQVGQTLTKNGFRYIYSRPSAEKIPATGHVVELVG